MPVIKDTRTKAQRLADASAGVTTKAMADAFLHTARSKTCVWHRLKHFNRTWQAACQTQGNVSVFSAEETERFVYCPYCRKPIEVEISS